MAVFWSIFVYRSLRQSPRIQVLYGRYYLQFIYKCLLIVKTRSSHTGAVWALLLIIYLQVLCESHDLPIILRFSLSAIVHRLLTSVQKLSDRDWLPIVYRCSSSVIVYRCHVTDLLKRDENYCIFCLPNKYVKGKGVQSDDSEIRNYILGNCLPTVSMCFPIVFID